ncbi:hypothetical protein [Mycetocola reblochoni]|uniref:COG1172: Ribose/xylose/arabinose/galactoside ABC-type transport systems, permease components n=2 Tax=Mycetocola reblochoni TaxID=331618 RepID=A0A1R4IS10_9MICO|nr:hypothetical protein [Mycetocola reblochoni]RLP71145.1 hypothetical protein D9V30_01655 [Mycetocola reblochoni]SJN22617.1 COG1172: Ribose/xylose/arabinose/galactoside ABC-type transport systems, permease components [Mycetocola reblochoni REB411]
MTRNTFIVGGLLVVVGVIGWALSESKSATALIPAFLGVVMLISGAIATKSQKIGVHIALVVAVIGVAGTAMNVVKIGELFAGTAERPLAIITSTITFVALIVFIVLGVRSFIAARRWKNDNAVSA